MGARSENVDLNIRVVADPHELSRVAAEEFVQLATEAVRERRLFTVALSGGSTPKSLYELLANPNEPYRARLCWEKMHFFWGDERHVPPNYPENNYNMVRETMLAKVPVPTENVHRIKSEIADARKAAQDYEQTLREYFKLADGQYPRFDLILLGIGTDGHIASIFPNSDVINEKVCLVVAKWIEKFQSYRITLTPQVLTNAAAVMVLVTGAEKANVLREVLRGEYQPERLPAQLLTRTKTDVLWLVDREAAKGIGSG